MLTYEREYNLAAQTARIFNTYGLRMRPDDVRVITTILLQALQVYALTIYTDYRIKLSDTPPICFATFGH